MSIWTGPYTSIKAAGTPATSATAMTSFMAKGNSLKLMVTTAGGGGAGTLTITASTSPDKETTYYQVVDRDSVWSMTSSVINTAGSYELALEGLAVVPGQYVRLYYACTNAAGTIAIAVDNWENPAGSIGVDVGDVVVDLDTVNTNTTTMAAAVGTDGATGPTKALSMAGTVLATGVLQEVNVDTDGDLQVDVLTLPGGLTGYAEDTAHVTGGIGVMPLAVRKDTAAALADTDGDYAPVEVDANGRLHAVLSSVTTAAPLQTQIGDGTTQAVVETSGTKKALNVNITDGTNDMPTMDTNARAGFVKLTDGTTDATLFAATGGLKVDLVGEGGAAIGATNPVFAELTDGTNAISASNPLDVTIATDDVVSTATGIHDVAAAAKLGGFRLLGNATSALQTAVSAANDDVKINTDLSGQLRLASHTIATTSDRVEEIDPLSAQYTVMSLISNEAVAADPGVSYAPSSTGSALGGYKGLSLQLYLLGGIGAAAVDRTVTVTLEATCGITVAAATVWEDVTQLAVDQDGNSGAASLTSTGNTAASWLLDLGNPSWSHIRAKYDWDGDPSVTNGIIVASIRPRAL